MSRRTPNSKDEVAQLVAAARSGDGAAMEELIRRFRPMITNFLASRWYPARYDAHEEAEDLAQRTFLKLPKVLSDYEEQGRFPAWLRQVANFEYLTRRRTLIKESLETLRTLGAGAYHEAPATLFPTKKAELREVVALLPPGEREAWEQWASGHTHAQIAAELGITVNASQVRVSRAKSRLVGMLVKHNDESARA